MANKQFPTYRSAKINGIVIGFGRCSDGTWFYASTSYKGVTYCNWGKTQGRAVRKMTANPARFGVTFIDGFTVKFGKTVQGVAGFYATASNDLGMGQAFGLTQASAIRLAVRRIKDSISRKVGYE